MLASLDIQNIVLIDRLSLSGDAGLVALTGETGAGKSILLDALGLALGARAEASLVRHGAAQASVTACFDIPPQHPARRLLAERGLDDAETLILRRTLGADGRSKAFINDAPVSVQMLRDTGALLVEIHGQFDTQGLMDPATHTGTLDTYAGTLSEAAAVARAWQALRDARDRLQDAENNLAATKLQEEYLRYTVAELEKLNPQAGEDADLSEKRQRLLNREKMAATFAAAAQLVEGDDGLQTLIGRLQSVLERSAGRDDSRMTALLDTLSRAKAEIDDIAWQVEKLSAGDADGESLDEIETRFFALRDCAKKHRCTPDDLPAVWADLSQRLRLVTHQDEALADLDAAVKKAQAAFETQAASLSTKRVKAAQKLAKAVNAELPALKLEKASFHVDCAPSKDPKDWNENGIDRVRFAVSTNPQTPPGPLHKIASGGELSRFMLALKVILAETGSAPTLVFDEVDSGIGGAVADAVGERLQRLSKKAQILVVTHSPQVAARARHHWHIAKSSGKDKKDAVTTRITPLADMTARAEEIARMLSGADITPEARAQARRLLENSAADKNAA